MSFATFVKVIVCQKSSMYDFTRVYLLNIDYFTKSIQYVPLDVKIRKGYMYIIIKDKISRNLKVIYL